MNADILLKYLILYKKLHIPGIGKFTIERMSAHLDFADKKLHPPVDAIMFTHENVVPDKHFYSFVAEQQSDSELHAIELFNSYVQKMQKTLKEKQSFAINGIGTLQQEYTDTYSFKPAYSVAAFLPTLRAERLLKESITVTKQQVSKKQKKQQEFQDAPTEFVAEESEIIEEPHKTAPWVKGAIVLLTIGVALLIAYFMQSGKFTV